MNEARPTVAILGASGLIGQAAAEALLRDGFPVAAFARRFTPAQTDAFGASTAVHPIADLDPERLAALLAERRTDVVLNCVGVLQDGPRGATGDVHQAFVARLLQAIAEQPKPVLLIHVSVPGRPEEDATDFSHTKREGERLIRAAGVPFAILRPGFVIAPAAYGGSALIRALAAIPVSLGRAEAGRPFAATAVGDIVRTVAHLALTWQAGERRWAVTWDIAERHATTVGGVVDAFRQRFGGPAPRFAMHAWLLRAGAAAGDLAARLGWSPPVRTTALREMLRGVECEPESWIAATGIEPLSLSEAVATLPATVQERWFARLFLLKPVIVTVLAVFWFISGLIALTVAFGPASAVLTAHGFSQALAWAVTALTSVMDMTVGAAIAFRRTSRAGMLAGIAVSLFYMISAALITPDLWVEPLGALVKTGPAIVLMAVALAILDDR